MFLADGGQPILEEATATPISVPVATPSPSLVNNFWGLSLGWWIIVLVILTVAVYVWFKKR